MLKLIINSTASVVEMNTFRKIVLLLGLGCHRINDNNLAIMDKPKYEDGFWAPVDESQGYKRITTLTVGAGIYSRCLYTEIDPGYNPVNSSIYPDSVLMVVRAEELVGALPF